jgi:hypothetical protein
MPIDASIISQAQNIPQIRYQPESQFESFAKIQPTLNAMQQMRTQAVQSQQRLAGSSVLQKMRQRLGATIQSKIGTVSVAMHAQTQAQMELGRQDGTMPSQVRKEQDQRPTVVGPGSALISHEGKELYRAPVDQKPANQATRAQA